jgi:hypothetical protein
MGFVCNHDRLERCLNVGGAWHYVCRDCSVVLPDTLATVRLALEGRQRVQDGARWNDRRADAPRVSDGVRGPVLDRH